jgi:hypothetical protein
MDQTNLNNMQPGAQTMGENFGAKNGNSQSQ